MHSSTQGAIKQIRINLTSHLKFDYNLQIKRSAGYENLKNDLKKWNSVITQQRTAENVSFPLRHPPMKAEPTGEFVKRFRIQSDLEKELYLIEPSTVDVPKENVLKLSLEEILQRRAETAKLRAEQVL